MFTGFSATDTCLRQCECEDAPLCPSILSGCEMQVLNIVEHFYDNPSTIPKRLLAKLLYGRDSVFARTPTPSQVRPLHFKSAYADVPCMKARQSFPGHSRS
jgi:hypothetical protein